MIEIPLLLVQHFLSLLRSAGVRRSNAANITFHADATGLTLQASNPHVTIQHRQTGDFDPCSVALPMSLLAECKGRKDELLTIQSQHHTNVLSWNDRGVPQQRSHPAAAPDKILALPSTRVENPPELLQALARAAEVTDEGSVRYALACIRIGGATGQIVSTDGRQLFAQSGFDFPWTDQLLIPGSRAFGCSVLKSCDSMAVGDTQSHMVFQIGSWTIWRQKNTEGRFPSIESYLSPPSARSTVALASNDAAFLARTISRLPASEPNGAVTLDLNGHIAVRAKADDQDIPTELVLSGSRYDGDPVRVATNRQYLARAARFGCDRVLLQGAEQLIYAAGENRCYAWMPLDASAVVRPSDQAVRIDSLIAKQTTSQQRPRSPMKRSTPAGEAISKETTGTISNPASPFEQLQTLQIKLRSALAAANELSRSLKRQKRQSRLVATTLQSLKQLQAAA